MFSSTTTELSITRENTSANPPSTIVFSVPPPSASIRNVASADNAIALSMSLPSPLSVTTATEVFLPKIASALNGTPAS